MKIMTTRLPPNAVAMLLEHSLKNDLIEKLIFDIEKVSHNRQMRKELKHINKPSVWMSYVAPINEQTPCIIAPPVDKKNTVLMCPKLVKGELNKYPGIRILIARHNKRVTLIASFHWEPYKKFTSGSATIAM